MLKLASLAALPDNDVMRLAGIRPHERYGDLVRLVPSCEGGYFIGTYGELPEAARVMYLGNLPEQALASAWDGSVVELRQYIAPHAAGLGRLAVHESCTVLLEKTQHGALLVNPQTLTELPFDDSFWERGESGLYLRGEAV